MKRLVLITIVLLTVVSFSGCSDSKKSFLEDIKIWKIDCRMGGEGCGKRQNELMKRQKDLGLSDKEINKLLK